MASFTASLRSSALTGASSRAAAAIATLAAAISALSSASRKKIKMENWKSNLTNGRLEEEDEKKWSEGQ